jgi:hypothetical protein
MSLTGRASELGPFARLLAGDARQPDKEKGERKKE